MTDSDIYPSPLPIDIEEEMRASYLDYAMSVIIGRALPDVRDGLKPVHRRVLFAMHELGNGYNRAYKKSARIVGDVIGKYHPHGDQAVYDTLVRMAQPFSMRHMLIDGQGNFGSIDGDAPAAMRYTEVRMAKLASELLADIDKETVNFGPNYDDSLEEPLVLPTRVPNLIVNGSAGIAVGMATNIPPHNLGEVIDATVALIKNPELDLHGLMEHLPGPDFPTGGIIYGTSKIRQAYETGRGIIHVRGKARVETIKDRDRIIIDELPYQVNKAHLVEKIAVLVREKRLEGISDIRDESDRDGMRVVIECKRDAFGEVILNQLYRLTSLQTSFGINMLAIVEGQPQVLSIKDILKYFLDHRREVVTRRSQFELREARKRFNVVFGLLAAIDAIDRIVEIIRGAPDPATAKERLMAEELTMTPAFTDVCNDLLTFEYETGKLALERGHVKLNERQAQAILDMRLGRLTGLERDKLTDEGRELRDTIVKLLAILGSDSLLMDVIEGELLAIKEEYANPRRTELVMHGKEISAEDLVADEDCVVTVSQAGYIKRVPLDIYQAQNRGGRGKTAATTRSEDVVNNVFIASAHSYVLVFTDRGKVYWLKVHQIPAGSRTGRGKNIVNLLPFEGDEAIAAVLPIKEFTEGHYLIFSTARGYIKKTDLLSFAKPRTSGLIALTIDDDDSLIGVNHTNGTNEIIIGTRMGMAIRFSEEDVRAMGRTARGVRSINLKKDDDAVVGMVVVRDDFPHLLSISERGFGKRTGFDEYRVQGRGGSGLINFKLSEKTGLVSGIMAARPVDDLMVITSSGIIIRTPVEQISIVGRSTQGVKIINIGDGDSVASIARVDEPTDEETSETAGEATDETIAEQSTTEGAEGGDAPSEA